MQSKEARLSSLFARARHLCKQAADFTLRARDLRLKAAELENPSNPKTDVNAAAKLRADARRATVASHRQFSQFFNAKREIETHLLRFGEPGRPFLDALEKLSFHSLGGPSQGHFYSADEDGILNGCQQFPKLSSVAVRTLAAPEESGKSRGVDRHPTGKSKVPRRVRKLKYPSTYSRADDDRYRRIGREMITIHDNPELWKRYRKQEQKLKPDFKYSHFRHSINRIRTHHKLPTSKQIQKSAQELAT